MLRGLVVLIAALASATVSEAHRLHNLHDFRGHGFLLSLSPDEAPANATEPVEEAYFDQALVDHSAPLSERKYWKQRYFINEEYWAGRDYPVFVYIGGEGPLGTRSLTNRNFINYLAKKHRALLVAVEHRYYGKSYPTPDMSTPNLRYLSSTQALEDLARFHTFLTDKLGLEGAKWVGFGGSYPGNLAAWVKLKYPSLFVGTVASSAPLLAKTNFYEYMEVVGDGLRYFGGGECYHRVEQSITALRKLMDGGREGRSKIDELFSPCYPMVNEFDDSVFESSIMGAFQDIAQYNGLKAGAMTLKDVCAHFTDESKEPIDLLASFLAKTRTNKCLDSKFEGEKNSTIDTLSKSEFDGESSSRQWFYQTCNEFGYFQTTTSKTTPFHALKTVTEQNTGLEVCKRVFGINESPDITSTNVEYGALGITVENVTFPSGTIDPWHALAVKNETYLHSSTAQSVYIEGTAHCADMYFPSEKDSPEIQWAHAKIAANVARYGIVPMLISKSTTKKQARMCDGMSCSGDCGSCGDCGDCGDCCDCNDCKCDCDCDCDCCPDSNNNSSSSAYVNCGTFDCGNGGNGRIRRHDSRQPNQTPYVRVTELPPPIHVIAVPTAIPLATPVKDITTPR